VCSVDNPSILNILNCKEEDIEKRKNYILGLKALVHDPTKRDKQNIDVVWRERNELETVYTKEN
uniref:hypothetical protein n=1 Tax=Aliarcobacter sp. TaxID=2321116 RepID=UPI004047D167